MTRSYQIPRFAALSLISICLAAVAAAPARGDFTYLVTVDTSAVAPGTTGFLDFQFNPGGSQAQPAMAMVGNFQYAGLTLGGLDLTGATLGSAPLPVGPIVLGNAAALNEGLQGVSFNSGGTFSFDVTLGGPAVNAPNGLSTAGTEFSLGVLDSAYNPLLPISLPVDPLITLDIAPLTGAITATSFAPSVATVTQSVVPEPASISLLMAGLVLAARLHRTNRIVRCRPWVSISRRSAARSKVTA